MLATSALLAQEEDAEEYFKPDYGMFSAEYQFSPLNENPLSIENLRMRYFIDYDMPLRFGVILDFQNNKPADDISLNAVRAGVKAGLEFHFEGTKRLSPYWGFELMFASQGYTATDDALDIEITGAAIDPLGSPDLNQVGFLEYGATLLLGFDLYLAKNFYMGAELGLSGIGRSFKDVEQTDAGTTTVLFEGGNQFRLNINALNLIRVGYAF
ncbi:MAG: hypothetical protein OHK0053_10410 [Microscillaceae bacterium]